jgi:diguanylate cyclase (GGDEF)-like protein
VIPAPLHPDEARRQAALERLRVLDTAPEERFDRITRLASRLLGTPIALVSLIDRDRQWFKSAVGLEETETPRELAFCAHAVADPDLTRLVVPDALDDVRFRDNPFVEGPDGIRAYAGQVVHSPEGYAIGTLCTIDVRPRNFDEHELQILADLAVMVEEELVRSDAAELMVRLDESERSKTVLLDALDEGMVLFGADATILQWNRRAEEILGTTDLHEPDVAAMTGRWAMTRRDGTRWEPTEHPAVQAMCTGGPVTDQLMGIEVEGHPRWLRVSCRPILDDAGVTSSVVAVFSDVTAELELQETTVTLTEALGRAEAFAQVALESLGEGVLLLDETGRIRLMNPAAQRTLDSDADTLTALIRTGAVLTVSEDGTPVPMGEMAAGRALFRREAVHDEVVRWVRHDGTLRLLRVNCAPTVFDDGARGVVVALGDVTEHQRLLDEIAHRATHDALTDLANRSVMIDQMARALARAERRGDHVALCYLDLDGFKAINDTLGHAAGDQVLIDVADRLRASVRAGDTPVRMGGDEFVVVLDPIHDADDALVVAARIRDAVLGGGQQVWGPLGVPGMRCGVSVGVAISLPGDDVDTLAARADLALYESKARRASTVELAVA